MTEIPNDFISMFMLTFIYLFVNMSGQEEGERFELVIYTSLDEVPVD
jgi:hypothetical protein